MKNTKPVILSYFGTVNMGKIDAMQINPAKAFVTVNDYSISFHQININGMCKKEGFLESGYLNGGGGQKDRELNFLKIRN